MSKHAVNRRTLKARFNAIAQAAEEFTELAARAQEDGLSVLTPVHELLLCYRKGPTLGTLLCLRQSLSAMEKLVANYEKQVIGYEDAAIKEYGM